MKLGAVERSSAREMNRVSGLQAGDARSDSATDERSSVTSDTFVEVDELHRVAVRPKGVDLALRLGIERLVLLLVERECNLGDREGGGNDLALVFRVCAFVKQRIQRR